MKKLVIILLIGGFIYLLPENKKIIIPDEAIRYRVIANSNTQEDQALKLKVKDSLNQEIYPILNQANNLSESRTLLKNNLDLFEQNVATTLANNHSNQAYQVNYGINHFPQKEFKGVTYPEGDYESLVVTLGDGQGDNWWCVLFPPLCLLEGEENQTDEVEYKFFVQEAIAKFFK